MRFNHLTAMILIGTLHLILPLALILWTWMRNYTCALALILQLLAANPIVFPGGPVAPVVDAALVIRSTLSLLAVSLIAGYIPAWITTREDILTAIRG